MIAKGGVTLEIDKKTLRSVFWGGAGCIFLYWLLHDTERLTMFVRNVGSLISPFVVGAALAFILNVPMRAIERWLSRVKKPGLRRGLALALTLLAVILGLYGVFYLLLPQLGDTVESLIDSLPAFFTRVVQEGQEYLEKHPELMAWIVEYTNLETINWAELIQKIVTLITNGMGTIVDAAITTVVDLGNGIFDAIMSLVFAIYAMARKETLARQFRRVLYAFLPEKVCDTVIRIMRMTNRTFSKFISGQCLEAVILGVMFAITMPIFGMPYVALISVLIAVTALVPIVGAFVGCVVGALLILVVDPVTAVWFVALFLVLQQIEGNLIYPKVVGTSIGLPGMWVLVAVVIGGDLMGIGGMLLMIPLTSVLYALLREITNKRIAAKNIDPEKLRDQPIEDFRRRTEKKKKRELAQKEKTQAADKEKTE